MVGEGACQIRVLRMELRIVPADTFLAAKNSVAVVADSTCNEVNGLVYA